MTASLLGTQMRPGAKPNRDPAQGPSIAYPYFFHHERKSGAAWGGGHR